jgi:protocatechuate 3,4-dioxygenase beta subunit
MQEDDRPKGSVLTRREAIALLGATGLIALSRSGPLEWLAGRQAWAAGVSAPRVRVPAGVCVVRPAQTEGPYFVDELLNRSDIRSDPFDASIRPGTQLQLTFNVSNLANSACMPLAGAVVDLWHCDAAGVYSDVAGAVGRKFLRGYQVTDANGVAAFTTIYPGWYPGRTVHLHFKVRSAATSNPAYEFTSQLYFEDSLTDQVYTQQPYASRGARSTRNANDGIFTGGGSQLLLAPSAEAVGYAATFELALVDVVSIQQSSWTRLKSDYE